MQLWRHIHDVIMAGDGPSVLQGEGVRVVMHVQRRASSLQQRHGLASLTPRRRSCSMHG